MTECLLRCLSTLHKLVYRQKIRKSRTLTICNKSCWWHLISQELINSISVNSVTCARCLEIQCLNCHFSRFKLISEHFGENSTTLAHSCKINYRTLNFVHFSGTPCINPHTPEGRDATTFTPALQFQYVKFQQFIRITKQDYTKVNTLAFPRRELVLGAAVMLDAALSESTPATFDKPLISAAAVLHGS